MTKRKTKTVAKKLIAPFQAFFALETASAILLLIVAAMAMVFANSAWSTEYFHLLHLPLSVAIGDVRIDHTLEHWVNDGLMVVFFLVVGLEIKRELLIGELSSIKQASLPLIAALGGMICPALIYTAFNAGTEFSHGWGIPMATDIAFALGILAMLGSRVPPFLKVFLAALAIADDLGAVLVIALFYTSEISLSALAASGVTFAVMVLLNRLRITRLLPYLLLAVALWFFVLRSGVHATIAGVLSATCIPAQPDRPDGSSPLSRLEHALHAWVAFLIMPVFAFTNAGVAIGGEGGGIGSHPVSMGIIFGLVLGKISGIFGFTWLATRVGLASLPRGIAWRQMLGVAALGGIGFTMSLFIAALAFTSDEALRIAKASILTASVIAGLIGYGVLRLSARETARN